MSVNSIGTAPRASQHVFDYAYEAMVAAYKVSGLSVQDFIDDINNRNRAIDELRAYKRAASEVIADPGNPGGTSPLHHLAYTNIDDKVYFFHNRQQYYIKNEKANSAEPWYGPYAVYDASGNKVNGASVSNSSISVLAHGNGGAYGGGYALITGMPDTSAAVFITRVASGETVVGYGVATEENASQLNFETVNTFISDRISSYSSTNQLDLIKLQKSINDMNLLVSMLTNMLKSVNDTNSTVARNI